MTKKGRIIQSACAVLLCVSSLTVFSGCSDRSKNRPKALTADGVAKSIDLEKRSVTMTIVDGKGNQRDVTGTFRDDTEVTINGRIQTIKDIKPGDKVTVQGLREGEGANQKLVATKVEVKRPEGADWKPTAKNVEAAVQKVADKASKDE